MQKRYVPSHALNYDTQGRLYNFIQVYTQCANVCLYVFGVIRMKFIQLYAQFDRDVLYIIIPSYTHGCASTCFHIWVLQYHQSKLPLSAFCAASLEGTTSSSHMKVCARGCKAVQRVAKLLQWSARRTYSSKGKQTLPFGTICMLFVSYSCYSWYCEVAQRASVA